MAAFDAEKAKELYARPLPNPIPNPAIIVVGADWCPDTKQTMVNNGYATETAEGIPIYYVNDNTPEGHAFLKTIPDAGEVLGAGWDAKEASQTKGAGRAYNYPTVIYTAVDKKDGTPFSIRIYADTVPTGMLLTIANIRNLQMDMEKKDKGDTGVEDPIKTAQFLDAQIAKNPLPNGLPADGTVIAIVDRRCDHCQNFLARANYPEKTEDGRAILYVDVSTEAGEAYKNTYVPEGGWPRMHEIKNGKAEYIGGGSDELLEKVFPTKLREEKAKAQATAALATPGGGTSVPHRVAEADQPSRGIA